VYADVIPVTTKKECGTALAPSFSMTLGEQTLNDNHYATRATPPPTAQDGDESIGNEAAGEDTLARIERNVELALGGIQALLRRIDSIDATLAKSINR
jgi:hypothetical protein